MPRPIIEHNIHEFGSCRVSLRFALLCALFLLVAVWLEPYLGPLNRATAGQVGNLLQFFAVAARVEGDLVTIGSFTVRIIPECTPLYPILLFGAFVIATPVALFDRVTGGLCGGGFLTAVNLARITVVTVVGAKHPGLFEILHLYLGQLVMLLLVIATSIVWLRWSLAPTELPIRIGFMLRALVSGSLLFFPWFMFNHGYVRTIDRLVAAIFSLADYRLIISYQHVAYYQTFNTVLFAAVLIAERRVSWQRRMLFGLYGGSAIFVGHLVFRICNVLLVAFNWQPALQISMLTSIAGEYLLPVLFWLALRHGPSVSETLPHSIKHLQN